MPPNAKTIRLSDFEDELLKRYCAQVHKTQNQVIRDLIVTLERKLQKPGEKR